MGERIAATLGAAIGLALALYLLVYGPMKANYERSGCVWLECEDR